MLSFYNNYQSSLISVTVSPSLCVGVCVCDSVIYFPSLKKKQTGLGGQACIITLVVISSNLIGTQSQPDALFAEVQSHEVQSINEARIQAGMQVHL